MSESKSRDLRFFSFWFDIERLQFDHSFNDDDHEHRLESDTIDVRTMCH